MKLIPKNWAEFQHYKDRAPPWVKLHRGLLDDREFQRLPVASRALAPMLWLLASESVEGHFDGSTAELAYRLRQTEKEITPALKPLIDKGFFVWVHDASTALSDCLQSATPETEERQRQRQRQTTEPPDGVPVSVWQDFQKHRKAKKAPITDTAMQGIKVEAEKAGYSLEDALRETMSRGWQSFKADWVANKEKSRQSIPGLI